MNAHTFPPTAYFADADVAELRARVAAMPRVDTSHWDDDAEEHEDDFIDFCDTEQRREHGTHW